MKQNKYLIINWIFVLIVVLIISCERVYPPRVYPPSEYEEHNLLVSYSGNSGDDIYIIDASSYNIVRILDHEIFKDFYHYNIGVSTNNDYLIFTGTYYSDPLQEFYILKYDISADSLAGVFPIGLKYIGNSRIIAAHLQDEPGIIYLETAADGTYQIDFFKEKCILIPNTSNFNKHFSYLSGSDWIVKNKICGNEINNSDDPFYSELEFYNLESHLSNYEFVLNKSNVNSVLVEDMAYSSMNDKLYISYFSMSKKDTLGHAYLGSFDMTTMELDTSHAAYPWNLWNYSFSYNQSLDECYMIGYSNRFYVYGVDSVYYYLKNTIELSNKTTGYSMIKIRPDNKVAFVSCKEDNLIIVVDLETKQTLTTISVESPFHLENI